MSFDCTQCQQPIEEADGWVVWLHMEKPQRIDKLDTIHEDCRETFASTLSAETKANGSIVHLQDLPPNLIGFTVYEPYLVAYSPNMALCLKHRNHHEAYTGIRRWWQLTIPGQGKKNGYLLEDVTIHNKTMFPHPFASVRVPEFMETSWIYVELRSGQVLRYERDLYDISIRLFGANTGDRLRHSTYF